MKILPLLWNMSSNRTQQSVNNRQHDYSQQRPSLLNTPLNDVFEKSITFTSERPEDVSPSRAPLEKLYKYHLTCLCCGREMIEPNEIKKLANSGCLRCNAPQAVEILQKYEGNMHSVEKEVFGILKEYSKKYPDLNFQQILTLIKDDHEKPLIATQFGIFKMIEKASEHINQELRKEIKQLIEEEKTLILEGNNQFRRKRFVNKFEQILSGGKNSATKEHLIRLANKLPTAYEDKNAFIVKYSTKTAEAIGIRLLSYSMCTIEHVRPKNPKTSKGENHLFNYIPECMRCNSFRQDRPMIQQLEEHPEMFFNAQLLMNRLVDFANRDKLSKWYIVKIQDRVKQESEGLLNLNIDELNMSMRMRREYAKLQEDPVEPKYTVDDEMAELRAIYEQKHQPEQTAKEESKQTTPKKRFSRNKQTTTTLEETKKKTNKELKREQIKKLHQAKYGSKKRAETKRR